MCCVSVSVLRLGVDSTRCAEDDQRGEYDASRLSSAVYDEVPSVGDL